MEFVLNRDNPSLSRPKIDVCEAVDRPSTNAPPGIPSVHSMQLIARCFPNVSPPSSRTAFPKIRDRAYQVPQGGSCSGRRGLSNWCAEGGGAEKRTTQTWEAKSLW